MKINEKQLSLKFRAKTFYFASLFFPSSLKTDIENLYNFCRFIDDLGDNPEFKKKPVIKIFKKIKKDIRLKKSRNIIINNFIKIVKKFNIDTKYPLLLIEGVENDLKKVNLSNKDELIDYSFKVAGTVGYMLCKIMGENSEKQIFKGIQLGIAMQLTNISRDIKEDLERQRIYLPKTMRTYKGNNYSLILSNKSLKKSFSNDLKKLLELADKMYLNAWEGINNLPMRFRVPIGLAASLYQQIGKKIEKCKFDIWENRIHVTFLEKIFISILFLKEIIFGKKIIIDKNVELSTHKVLKRI